MTYSTIDSRKQHWLDFYDLTSARRLVFVIRYDQGLPARPLPNPDRREERLEWIWRNYEHHLKRMEWLADDSLPCLDMLTGTEIFAEAFGCKIHRPDDNNPFALPCVNTPEEAQRLPMPSLDARPLAFVFEMADELARRAGPGAIFRLVDMQSPLDVAALIWEKTSFYTALLEYPEVVIGVAEKIKTLQFAFLDEWFRRYGREFIAHYPDYYLPHGATLSVDEIGAVSGKIFARYFLPDLNLFSQRYGGLGMHCCANARHQWARFKEIDHLRLLNINQRAETLREAYPYFADFVPQWHISQSSEPPDPRNWLKEIPAKAHVVLEMQAESREQAMKISADLQRLAGD